MASTVGERPELAIPFESIRSVLKKRSVEQPDKTAIQDLDQDRSITYQALWDAANRIARHLAENGIGKGDRIGILSDESLEKLIIWMGIWRLGAVVCPLNIEMNEVHIAEILKTIGPKLTLVADDLDAGTMTRGIDGEIVKFSHWRADAEGDAGADEFFARVACHAPEPELEIENGPDDMSCIFCTSGTTSRPKSVVYNHMAYWLNGLNTLDMLGLTADDKTLEYRSFGWNSAQVLSLMPWIETGYTMCIAKRFSHSRFFEWIKEHGITFSAGVPTVVNMLLNKPLGVTADDIPTLRLMTCSTAPLPPDQWERFETMYGVTLLQLYGMSETGWICGNRHYRRRMGTVGPPARHQEFIIVDGDGEPCPQGVEGEVTVGGPQACIAMITPEGVWEDQKGVRLRTGDLAVMDEDGFVRVTGRTKDLIIRGGVNIAPLEIDNIVMANPAVAEAASVGVPDPIYGEEVVCYVVAKPGEKLTEDDVISYCAETLPEFKLPKRVYFVDELPKSDRGKVIRDTLQEQWKRENAPA